MREEEFGRAVRSVLSEPQLDVTYEHLPPRAPSVRALAVEFLPGQFDQRADSAAQCIQFLTCGERPTVRTARVYLLDGDLTDEQMEAVKKALINPVEAREASLDTSRNPEGGLRSPHRRSRPLTALTRWTRMVLRPL